MRLDIAKQPPHYTVVRWDGDNQDEMNDYLKAASTPGGKVAELVVQSDGTAYVSSYYPNKPVAIGDYVYAESGQFGGPMVTVYSPAEANALLYPYPTFPAVATDAQST